MFSGIEKLGDWAKMRKLSRDLKTDLKKVNHKTLMKVGLFAEAQAVKAIESQELPWHPLSEKYLKKKIAAGESEKTLVATSTYLASITSTPGVGMMVRDAQGKFTGRATVPSANSGGSSVPANTVFVGVLKGVKDENGEEVANIAATLEYGSEKRNIQARPLWSVVYRRTEQYVVFTNIFAEEAYKFIIKRHGIK